MDRHYPGLAFAFLLAASLSGLAQSPIPSPSASPATSPTLKHEEAGRRLQQMTPEERQKLLENTQKWKSMSKEERQAIRLQAKLRRERMEKSVDDLAKKNGWTLSPERRQELLERFAEERRNIEEILRKEMDEKRRPMIKEMIEKLKMEFSPGAASSPTATPTASPAP